MTGRKTDLITRLEEIVTLFDPHFPRELQKEILLNLKDNEIDKICRTSKQAVNIYEDDDFWRLRIEKIYNSDLSKYKELKTYRDIYI